MFLNALEDTATDDPNGESRARRPVMNSSNSTPSTDDANSIENLSIDEPFDGESTGVRPRILKRLPLVHDALCEEISRPEDDLPSEEFVLPSWEELTGLHARTKTTERRHSYAGRQQAIDLVEAEQRRRSTAPGADEQMGQGAVVSGMSRGGGWATVEPVAPPLPWVDRFERDTNARLEAPELEGADEIASLEERYAPSAGPLLAVVPPPPVSRATSELTAPPNSRPISRPHVPSSFPANRPLPRFALGPRMEGLLGPERRPLSSSLPASLAPVAANDVRLRERMNPWAAGLLGALISAAAGFAFFWSPQPESKSAASMAVSAIEQDVSGAEARVRPFAQDAAQQLAKSAGEKARACGMGGVPTEVGVTFAPDGSVMSVEARGESRLSEDTGYCMDDAFSNLRIPPFDGEARRVRLNLR
jgi:hypothetical protein